MTGHREPDYLNEPSGKFNRRMAIWGEGQVTDGPYGATLPKFVDYGPINVQASWPRHYPLGERGEEEIIKILQNDDGGTIEIPLDRVGTLIDNLKAALAWQRSEIERANTDD